jgi:ketosteroid isomerase-like protein
MQCNESSMESREAAQIADEGAIRKLVSLYSDSITRLDAARAASVYADDGVVSIVGVETIGRSAIENGMLRSFAQFQLLQLIAHAGVIRIDGDSASACWSTVELGVRRGSSALDCIFGRYEDTLARLPEGWRFTRRVFVMAGRTRIEAAKIQLKPEFFSAVAPLSGDLGKPGGLSIVHANADVKFHL